jgi:Zn-dependent protease
MLSVCFHEFGHAIVAYGGGDTSVKDKGYLTFNIFKYTDPGMTLFFPVLILMIGGIALPGAAVYIDNSRLRSRLWQSAVSAAGPIATFLSAVIFAIPFLVNVPPSAIPPTVWAGLAFLISLEMFAFILNSLPIPPFDGYGVIEPWLPKSIQEPMNKFGVYSMWIVFLVLFTVQPVSDALWIAASTLTSFLGVPVGWANVGGKLFRDNAGYLIIGLLVVLFLMSKRKKHKSDTEWYREAQKLVGENKPVEAIEALNEALTINPNFPEAWHLRGLCFGLTNKNDDAMDNFNKALQLNPQYADCWYNKAVCNALQGKQDDALMDLYQAVRLSPDTIKEHAMQDVGFRSLRADPRFQRIVAKTPS